MAAKRSILKAGSSILPLALISALITLLISCAATYQGEVGKGSDLLKAERYDDSIAAFEEALILAEEEGEIVTSEVYVSLGQSYEAVGNTNKAIVYYRRGASMDGGYPEIFYKMGLLQEAQGQLPEAGASFQSALSLEPENPEYLAALRRTLEGADLHGAYVDAVIDLVAMGDEGAEMLKGLGVDYLQSGFTEAGVQALEASLGLKPGQVDILAQLGQHYLSQGQMSDASRVLEARLSLTPQDIPTLRGLGEAYIALGEGPKALEAYQTAVALDPGDASLKAGAQVARHLTGESQKALRILRQLTRKSPKEPSLHLAAARIHIDLKQLRAADTSLSLGAPLAPDAYDTFLLTGALSMAQGRYDAAITPLTQAREARPMAPLPATLLCRAYASAGSTSSEALRACDDALILSPKDADLMPLNADLLLKAGQYQEGASIYLALLRGDALGADAPTFEVAQMLLALDRGEDAEGVITRAEATPQLMALLSRVEADVYGDDRGRSRAEGALGGAKADLRVLSEVARFYIAIDEALEAKPLLNKAQSKAPKDIDVLKAQAAFDIAQGRGGDALVQLRAIVDKHPGDVDAQALLAAALESDGQGEEAKALRESLGLR